MPGTDLFKLLLSAFKRLTTAITGPFRMMIVRVQRMFNVNIITAKLIAPLTKKVKSLITLRPQSRADYYSIGRYWVYKKLFLTLILALCAGVFLYFIMFAPKLPAQPAQPVAVRTSVTFAYDDMKLSDFTGVANIQAADGRTVFTGEIDSGVCSGSGVLYTRDGKLLYEGEFDRNQYNGKGVQYYADGAVRYEGEFADNLYSGAGKLYDGRGALIYDGTFRAGLYDGEGKLYGESGLLLYEGAFVKGEYHGAGVSYYSDGTVQYKGEFFGGKPQGTGTLYSAAGKELYTGPMHGGEINYRALVNATLAEVEEAFTETPKVYYDDRDSCFVFEQAGVILSTDCRVRVDVWEKPRSVEEQASEYYYLPDGTVYQPPLVQEEIQGMSAGRPAAPAKPSGGGALFSPMAWFVPDDAPSSSSSRDEDATMEDLMNDLIERMDELANAAGNPPESSASEDEPPAVEVPQQPGGETGMPDFVEKNISLYFEIDKDVWQSEAELDKSKVLVNKVTVMRPGAPIEGAEPYDDSLPPSIEDCVAIDFARQQQPTVFSNILFEMDKQNKLFVRLKNISYAERIVRRCYDWDGMTYRYCYQLDNRDAVMYYSIES